MKHFYRLALFALAALTLIATGCGGDGGSITVEQARYRLANEGLAAGYLSVTNTTDASVTLQAASAEGVGRIELHESFAADDGTMAMEARPEGFEIPAGGTLTLEPGGKHLMLFDPGTTGADLTIELDFGDETISVVAAFDEAASAMTGMDDTDHGDDDAMDGDEG